MSLRRLLRRKLGYAAGVLAVALAAAVGVPAVAVTGATHADAGVASPGPAPIPAGSIAPHAQDVSAITPNIIGGYGVTTPLSYMASLQYDAPAYNVTNHHTCGATLVFRNWAVTNAHCVTDPPPGTDTISLAERFHMDGLALQIPTADKAFHVRVGSLNRTTGGDTADVDRIVVNPGWNWLTQPGPADDIAMLHLDHYLNEQPIQVSITDPPVGAKVTEYGWGVDDPASPSSGPPDEPELPLMLQANDTSIVPRADCTDSAITAGEVCLDNTDGTNGACYGDSGGPAIWVHGGHPLLVGGASRMASPYCGVTKDVYTGAADFRSWIFDTARGIPAGSAASPQLAGATH